MSRCEVGHQAFTGTASLENRVNYGSPQSALRPPRPGRPIGRVDGLKIHTGVGSTPTRGTFFRSAGRQRCLAMILVGLHRDTADMYRPEVRRQALALIDSGHSLSSISMSMGINRSTLREW